MRILITFLAVSLSLFSCINTPKPFGFIIKGKIIGKENGEICFLESMRAGDEVTIPIKNGQFEYKGTSSFLYMSAIVFCDDNSGQAYTFVVEPGEIILEIHADSLIKKSKTIKGNNSIAVQKAVKVYSEFNDSGMDMEALLDSMKNLINQNRYNYASIMFMNTLGKRMPILDNNELGQFLNNVSNPMFQHSRDFIELYSFWLAKKDSINAIKKQALNFELSDETRKQIEFNKVAKGKITLVEKSGSWCANSTANTKSFLPIYESYKDSGFEIITIVCESKYERWVKWIEKEKFPWITLIESEKNNNGKLYSEILFVNGNYLVDEQGIVIANNLSAKKLEEILMKKFEPEKY